MCRLDFAPTANGWSTCDSGDDGARDVPRTLPLRLDVIKQGNLEMELDFGCSGKT